MATFTDGQVLSLTFDYDDAVTFSGKGVATITTSSGSVYTSFLSGVQVLGPYKQNSTSVSIACSGTGTYTQTSTTVGPVPTYSLASDGTPTGLVGPSGQVMQLRNANTLAIIGDSVSALWRSVGATISERNPKGYITWALALSKDRLTVVSDQSLGGSMLTGAGAGTNISATQLPLAIASGAGHLLVQGGVNDFFQAGAAVADVKAAWLTIVNSAIAAGMTVWWVIAPTVNSAYSSYSVAAQGKMLEVNDWIRQQASTQYAKRGVFVVDLAAVVVDPASTTASGLTNYLYDNLHPRNIGAYPMGAELARMWNLFIPESHQLLSSNADNKAYSASSTNILTNGLFVTGAAPGTGFTRSLTGTAGSTTETLVARADGFGFDLQEVCTFAANNDSLRVTTGDLKANVSSGDVLVAECEVTLSSYTATRCVRLNLSATGASSSFTATTMQLDATNDLSMAAPMPASLTMTLRTNPFTVDTVALGALTNVQSQVSVFGSGAGGATLKIGRWSVRKITATA